MWVLTQVCEKEDQEPMTYRLCAGKFAVGRKEAAILVTGKSVSRRHAEIVVGELSQREVADVTTRQFIGLTDLSKFGTILNTKKMDQSQGQKNLQDGDEIVFGTINNDAKFRVGYEQMTLCPSGLVVSSMQSLRNSAAKLGAHIQEQWSSNVTHLVMDCLTATPLLCYAVLHGVAVVSCEWFTDVVSQPVRSSPFPKLDRYRPTEHDRKINLDSAISRNVLFSGRCFIFLSARSCKELQPLITLCGGVTEVWDSTDVAPTTLEQHGRDESVLIMRSDPPPAEAALHATASQHGVCLSSPHLLLEAILYGDPRHLYVNAPVQGENMTQPLEDEVPVLSGANSVLAGAVEDEDGFIKWKPRNGRKTQSNATEEMDVVMTTADVEAAPQANTRAVAVEDGSVPTLDRRDTIPITPNGADANKAKDALIPATTDPIVIRDGGAHGNKKRFRKAKYIKSGVNVGVITAQGTTAVTPAPAPPSSANIAFDEASAMEAIERGSSEIVARARSVRGAGSRSLSSRDTSSDMGSVRSIAFSSVRGRGDTRSVSAVSTGTAAQSTRTGSSRRRAAGSEDGAGEALLAALQNSGSKRARK